MQLIVLIKLNKKICCPIFIKKDDFTTFSLSNDLSNLQFTLFGRLLSPIYFVIHVIVINDDDIVSDVHDLA